MTVRAVILGLVASLFIAGFGYINNWVMRLTFIDGNHMPNSVFGLLLVLVLVANPVIWLVRRGGRLRAAELAVMVAMMMVACSIPGSGLLRTFTPAITLPIQDNAVMVGWQKNKVLDYVPPSMMPNGGKYDKRVIDPFISSGGADKPQVDLSAVPWDKWAAPLATWMPLILMMALASICIALVVHRQWSSHERLRYPIATVAEAFSSQDGSRPWSAIFRDRLFWIGLAIVLAIRVINGIKVWYPDSIEIPMDWNFPQVVREWPWIGKGSGHWALFHPYIYPTVIAFGFLLASEVSLSLGISQAFAVVLTAALVTWGVDISGDRYTGSGPDWMRFGSWLGMVLMILYTGRRYYTQVLRVAITFRHVDGVEAWAAWAARGVFVSVAGMTAMLSLLGMAWPLALILVLLALLMFLVIARLTAESGLFFMDSAWQPLGVMMGMFGGGALGPQAIVVSGMMCTVLTIDPRCCLMPYVVNGLKICEKQQIRPGRTGGLTIAVYALCLAAGVAVALGSNYSKGELQWDTWGSVTTSRLAFDEASRQIDRLTIGEQLQESKELSPLGRVAAMKPDRRFLIWGGIGLGAVLLFSIMRLRHTWWPIHPVMFLVWNLYPMWMIGHSFLLGWLIKMGVTRLGGPKSYKRTMVFMFGAIAGDLLAGLIFMIVGAWYYAHTGNTPKEYRVFPG